MVLTHLFWQKPLKVNGNQLLNFFLSQMINQNKKKKAFLDYRLDDLYVWSVFPVNYIRHFFKRPILNERHRIGEFCKLDCMFFKHQYHEYNQELQNICALNTQCIVWSFDSFSFSKWYVSMRQFFFDDRGFQLWRCMYLEWKSDPW